MAALAGAGLGGCGFALRQPPRLTFSSIALTGFAPRSPLAEELRRQLALQVRVHDAPDTVDVVLQALAPPRRIRLLVTAGPAGDIVTARIGGDRQRLVLPPLRTREVVLESPRPALGYYGTSLYRLRVGSRFGGPTDKDRRHLGSFVYVELEERK